MSLDDNNASSRGNEEGNSSSSSENEEDIRIDASIIKDDLKRKVINSAKEKNTMMEGSVPDFNDKPFCHSFSMPAGNMALNEMIAGERKGVQTFFASSSTHLSRKKTPIRCSYGR